MCSNVVTAIYGEKQFHMTKSWISTSGLSSLIQNAFIGALHQTPPSSIKKWNTGALSVTEATPKITTGNFKS
jgi:hypothetical protein